MTTSHNALFFSLLFLFFWFFSSCGSNTNQNDRQTLQKAADLHNEALAVEQKMKPHFEQLVQFKNSTSIQGRALTEVEISLIDQVEQLQSRFTFWEENHVEVPGFEHDDHDHDHAHHDHNHGTGLKVLPADMLLIQQEFKDSILAIQKDVIQLSEKVKTVQPGFD